MRLLLNLDVHHLLLLEHLAGLYLLGVRKDVFRRPVDDHIRVFGNQRIQIGVVVEDGGSQNLVVQRIRAISA